MLKHCQAVIIDVCGYLPEVKDILPWDEVMLVDKHRELSDQTVVLIDEDPLAVVDLKINSRCQLAEDLSNHFFGLYFLLPICCLGFA